MNNTRVWRILATAAVLIAGRFGSSANAENNLVTNISSNPNIFLCDLTATNLNVTVITTNGATVVTNTVRAMVYRDENAPGWPQGAGIPIPVMNVKTGQMVICRFKNNLSNNVEGASIHWHGIELDNDSDGTGVTQDSVLQGQSYTYKFKVPRPGLFWFHSHMMPGNTTFAGMYGVMIIPNNSEAGLIISNKLPTAAYTYTLALSDIEFATNNAYAPNYPTGTVGKQQADGTAVFKTINQWSEDCHDNPANNALCNTASKPGTVVLVNGEHPIGKTGSETPLVTVPTGKLIRLRLLNEALVRTFRLKLLDASGNQINLFRVGGQGGLLDKVRLEGGTNGTWDTTYTRGEIVISSGDRVDVIALTPTNAADNSVLRLVGNPLNPPFRLSGTSLNGIVNIPSNYPVAFFKISGTASDTAPTTNDLLLAGGPEQIESIKTSAVKPLVDPAPLGRVGTTDEVIHLTSTGSSPSLDGIRPTKLDGNVGNGDFLTIPNTNSTRYARIGDVLQLSVKNETQTAHPFHLHGFSMQPVRVTTTNDIPTTLYTYEYNEFIDTIDVYGGQTLVFRVRLDDRQKFCDESPGATSTNGPVLLPCIGWNCSGALNRWLYHCHIFPHAGIGMIGELVVLEDLSQTNQSKVIKQPDLTPTGVDVLATLGTGSQMVADDFQCTTNGLITGISIWGSWLNNFVDTNTTFELKFWSDVPGSPSSPGVQLWRRVFPPRTYSNNFAGSVFSETFYDPSQPFLPNSDTQVYRYDFTIPQCDAFYQSFGNIYWLSVTAYPTNGFSHFGWKTCITNDYDHDDATWSFSTNSPTFWNDLHYPSQIGHPYTNSMDMAFELDTAVSTNCTPPVVSFYGDPISGSEPLTVNFTDISTGSITNRSWNFGDGSTTNITTTSVSHVYTANTYSVTLTVTGPCGTDTVTATDYIVVTCSPAPVALFNGAPTNGVAPLTVNFVDFSTGTITNRFWNFGDGSTTNITVTSPSHTYTNAGTYTVALTVSGPCGTNTLTKFNFITVRTLFDVWLAYYFPSGGTNSLPDADPDGDGMSNTNEFLAGFNPTNNAAYLRIINILKTSNDLNVIYLGPNGDSTWSPGIFARTNVLEFTKGRPDGSYSNNFATTGRTNFLYGGTGLGVVTNVVESGGATNVPSRYYRIRVLP